MDSLGKNNYCTSERSSRLYTGEVMTKWGGGETMRVSLHKRSQHRGIERRETEGENIRPQGKGRSREDSWIGVIERNARGRIVNQILAVR